MKSIIILFTILMLSSCGLFKCPEYSVVKEIDFMIVGDGLIGEDEIKAKIIFENGAISINRGNRFKIGEKICTDPFFVNG